MPLDTRLHSRTYQTSSEPRTFGHTLLAQLRDRALQRQDLARQGLLCPICLNTQETQILLFLLLDQIGCLCHAPLFQMAFAFYFQGVARLQSFFLQQSNNAGKRHIAQPGAVSMGPLNLHVELGA